MRTPFIAGNWKMNTTLGEAQSLVREMRSGLDAVRGVDKAVMPPFISLAAVSDLLRGTTIGLGAQNMHFEEKGAYTGEVSPAMLRGMCQYVILGHSERRQYFAESNELVNKKIMAALKAGLKPILCVGERLEENESGKTEQVVSTQVLGCLAGVPATQDLVVAYEPIWAIGTGKAATSDQAQATISMIRQKLAQAFGAESAARVRILYGGSVTSGNISDLMSRPDIDGALVGGASLKAQDFVSIVEKSAAAKKL